MIEIDDGAPLCAEGCGRPATVERVTGFSAPTRIPDDPDGFDVVTELVCLDCYPEVS